MPALDLQPKHLRLLLEVLDRTVPRAEIWAYGSRVNGNAHEGSDLDLVLYNSERVDEPMKNISLLREALAESNLPILVDVLDWARLTEDMRREIQREHILLRPPHAQAESHPL